MKKCTICDISKPIQQFYKVKFHKGKQYYRSYCKECAAEKQKERLKNKPPPYKKYDLKKCYGMDIKHYQDLVKKQNGVCAICKQPCSTGRNLSVDHCHKNNFVRGLLCNNCNQGLGRFKDNIEYLMEAISYLTNHLTAE